MHYTLWVAGDCCGAARQLPFGDRGGQERPQDKTRHKARLRALITCCARFLFPSTLSQRQSISWSFKIMHFAGRAVFAGPPPALHGPPPALHGPSYTAARSPSRLLTHKTNACIDEHITHIGTSCMTESQLLFILRSMGLSKSTGRVTRSYGWLWTRCSSPSPSSRRPRTSPLA